MLLISPTEPKKNVLSISKFQSFVSGMADENSVSREKKTLGYKERCEEKRQAYRQALAEKHTAGKKIVYVDECGFRAESYRRHGYVPIGASVLDLISGTRTRTTTLVTARIDSTFSTPCLFDGICDAACFNTWLETYLCPRLSASGVVVLDNTKIHKTHRTRELIEASGAEVLFLPPYSPNYNPIEHDFAISNGLENTMQIEPLMRL